MQICKVKNYQELSRKAANLIAAQIILKPDSILGLATGSSPVGTYEHLVEMYENGDLDFSQVTTVNLDEYKGLAGSDEQSYRYFMNTHLFHKININHANTYVPNGTEPDAEKACQAYNELLHKIGPADIQILGLGHDGHIGFNEPGTSFDSTVHVVDLEQSTIEANARFFDKIEDVPTQAYSMGIRNILDAKSIILFAYGASKAKAIAGTVEGPITEELPGSALQKHEDVVVIADKEALSILKNKNLFPI